MATPLALPLPAPDSDPIASLLGQHAALAESRVAEMPVGSEYQAPGSVRPAPSVVPLAQLSVERADGARASRLAAKGSCFRIPTLHRVKFFLRLGVGRDSSDEPS